MNMKSVFRRLCTIITSAMLAGIAPSCENSTEINKVRPTGHFSIMQVSNASTKQMMSYILQTSEGNVIVIDGGNYEDAANLRHILKSSYGNKVTAWWITHPHSDHIGALRKILTEEDRPEIKHIYHSRFSQTHLKLEASAADSTKKFYAILDTLKSTKVTDNVRAGEDYDMDGIQIKVLGVTNEEIKTNAYNNSSIILRFEDDTKSVLFLGDTGEESGRKVMKRFPKYLDCDYIQMAHHGQKGVSEDFYKSIDFKACLWPTPDWLWKAADGNPNGWETWKTRQWMQDKNIVEHHIMWEETNWYMD